MQNYVNLETIMSKYTTNVNLHKAVTAA